MKYKVLVLFLILFQSKQTLFAAAQVHALPRSSSLPHIRVACDASLIANTKERLDSASQATPPLVREAEEGLRISGDGIPLRIRDIPTFNVNPLIHTLDKLPPIPNIPLQVSDITISINTIASLLGTFITGYGFKLIADSFKIKQEGTVEQRQDQLTHKKSLIKGGTGLAISGSALLFHQQLFALLIKVLVFLNLKKVS